MSVPFYDENLYLLNMKNDLEAKVSFYMLENLYASFFVYVYCFTHEVEPASYGSCLWGYSILLRIKYVRKFAKWCYNLLIVRMK